MVHSTTPRAFSWPFWENNDFQVMQHVVGVAAIRLSWKRTWKLVLTRMA